MGELIVFLKKHTASVDPEQQQFLHYQSYTV